MSFKFMSTARSIFCYQLLLIAFTIDVELGVDKEMDGEEGGGPSFEHCWSNLCQRPEKMVQ